MAAHRRRLDAEGRYSGSMFRTVWHSCRHSAHSVQCNGWSTPGRTERNGLRVRTLRCARFSQCRLHDAHQRRQHGAHIPVGRHSGMPARAYVGTLLPVEQTLYIRYGSGRNNQARKTGQRQQPCAHCVRQSRIRCLRTRIFTNPRRGSCTWHHPSRIGAKKETAHTSRLEKP